jgi:hypothetical protein
MFSIHSTKTKGESSYKDEETYSFTPPPLHSAKAGRVDDFATATGATSWRKSFPEKFKDSTPNHHTRVTKLAACPYALPRRFHVPKFQ